MRYKIIAMAAMLATSLNCAAQDLRTSYFMQTSDLRHEMNPALLDHTYVSMPLLGNFNLGTRGNVGAKTFIFDMQPGWDGYGVDGRTKTTFMHPEVDAADFLGGLKNNNRLGVNLKYQVFGFAFKGLKGLNSIELNLRSNSNVSVPKSLFEFMKTTGSQTDYDISKLGVHSETFAELALGHSHKVNDKWTIGAKVKILAGGAYANLNSDHLDVHLSDDYWRVKGNITGALSVMGMKMETSMEQDPENPNRYRVDDISTDFNGLGGLGGALDLGVTWKPTKDLTVSAALNDLGAIRWRNTQLMSSTGEWTFDGFDEDIYAGGSKENGTQLDKQLEDIGDDMEDLFAVYYDGEKTKRRGLSPTLHLGVEYALPCYDKLRFGFLFTSRMAGQYAFNEGMLSLNIRPVKAIEVSLSGSASTSGVSGGMVLDLHAKHFNFFVGTDCFLSKMGKYGVPLKRFNNNVSFGFGFPISKV